MTVFIISDVERVLLLAAERAEELIQVKYPAACCGEPLLLIIYYRSFSRDCKRLVIKSSGLNFPFARMGELAGGD
jgi:hypothetical protein